MLRSLTDATFGGWLASSGREPGRSRLRAGALLLVATGCSFEPILPAELREGEADVAPDPTDELPPATGGSTRPRPNSAAPASCRELRERDPSLPDGEYAIGAEPRRVWCDMTVDGGGWTLAGRSVASPFGGSDEDDEESAVSYEPFGWGSSIGEVDEDLWPYSLDVVEAEVPFTEILVGTRGDGKRWGEVAIVLPAGADFLVRCGRERCAMSPRAVIGDCVLESTRYAGITESYRLFVLDTENQGQPSSGLYARGFNVSSSGCSNVDGAQGMIFVR